MDTRTTMITFSEDKITFFKSDMNSKPALFNQEGIKLELTIGRIFHKALNKTRVEGIFEKNDFEFLGSILFKVLSLIDQEDARNFVYNELNHILREGLRGVIVFDFDDSASDLAVLPWEYLQIGENKEKRIKPFYLGAHSERQFDLVRLIRNGLDISIDHSPKNLKKLSVVKLICNPVNDSIDINEFEDCFVNLEKKFKNEAAEPLLETWRIEDPRVEDFIQEMKNIDAMIEGDYILHFYGHARLLKEKAEIAFIAEDGTKQWVPLATFENLFGDEQKYKQPKAFVMQACESGQLTKIGEGLAPSLIKKNIPFVLAMQNEVTSDTSMAFFTTFYESLLSGEDFFKAVTTGRVFLGCKYGKKNPDISLEHYNDNSFGTPVLFTSSIVPIRFFPEKQDEKPDEKQRKLVCPECNTKYEQSSGREICIKGRCRGRLELEKSKKAEARMSATSSNMAESNILNPKSARHESQR